MKIFLSRKDSLEFWLSFFLISGAVAGSIFCNWMDGQMKEELRTMEGSMVTAAVLLKMDFWGLFLAVLKRRLSELLLVLLFAMTQAAPFFFMAVCGYLGFSAAVTVCALTMDGGLLGIFKYMALVFPQAVFYGAVFYVVVWWMPGRQKHMTALAAAVLAAAVVLGSAAESFINPWLVACVLGK